MFLCASARRTSARLSFTSRTIRYRPAASARPHSSSRHLHSPTKETASSQHQPRPKPASRTFTPVQASASGIFTVAVALGIAIGGVFYYTRPSSAPAQASPALEKHRSDRTDEFRSLLDMPTQTLPGRPGNLTAEQEEKLREMWQATLKVFGVHDPTSDAATNGSATPTPSETGSGAGEKKKRSRLHVFKRKDKDGVAGGGASGGDSGSSTPVVDLAGLDEDDKHGQNKQAKQALADSTPEDLRNTFWSMVKHDHPDGLLLRFLRARKWDVPAALAMMISTMHWRKEEMHVDDDVILRGEEGALLDSQSSDPVTKKEGEDFLAQMRMGKSYLHGVDKEGRPMCFVRVRLHKQGEQTETSLERFTVYTIETARMLLRPPVDTATIVFDMTNFSMANMDYSPVKFMIKCFEANYPESLGAVLVHKAPWIFQGIWNIIRGWLDPVVAGKIHFTKSLEDLTAHIAPANIPRELGGTEDWSYHYVEPAPGENAAMTAPDSQPAKDALLAERRDLVAAYEEALLRWVHADGGHADDQPASARRDALAARLRENYWRLDPFVRARSLYDRTGVLGPDGALRFYPEREGETQGKGAVQTSEADLD